MTPEYETLCINYTEEIITRYYKTRNPQLTKTQKDDIRKRIRKSINYYFINSKDIIKKQINEDEIKEQIDKLKAIINDQITQLIERLCDDIYEDVDNNVLKKFLKELNIYEKYLMVARNSHVFRDSKYKFTKKLTIFLSTTEDPLYMNDLYKFILDFLLFEFTKKNTNPLSVEITDMSGTSMKFIIYEDSTVTDAGVITTCYYVSDIISEIMSDDVFEVSQTRDLYELIFNQLNYPKEFENLKIIDREFNAAITGEIPDKLIQILKTNNQPLKLTIVKRSKPAPAP